MKSDAPEGEDEDESLSVSEGTELPDNDRPVSDATDAPEGGEIEPLPISGFSGAPELSVERIIETEDKPQSTFVAPHSVAEQQTEINGNAISMTDSASFDREKYELAVMTEQLAHTVEQAPEASVDTKEVLRANEITVQSEPEDFFVNYCW